MSASCRRSVAQVFRIAVSPTSQSAALPFALWVKNPARQQDWKVAPREADTDSEGQGRGRRLRGGAGGLLEPRQIGTVWPSQKVRLIHLTNRLDFS